MRACVASILLIFASCYFAAGEELPVVSTVEHQPLAAQVLRVIEALEYLGEPLPAAEAAEIRRLTEVTSDRQKAV
jgi:hypothetical protein